MHFRHAISVALLALAPTTAFATPFPQFGSPFLHSSSGPSNGGGGGGFQTVAVVAGDFNGDGRLDVVSSNSTDNGSISVMIGDGSGAFSYRGYSSTEGGSVASRIMELGDLDRDNDLDLVMEVYDRLVVFRGNDFARDPSIFLSGRSIRDIAIDDVNEDGWPDVLAATSGGQNGNMFASRVAVFLNDGTGYLSDGGGLTPDAPTIRYAKLETGDVDKDGFADVIGLSTIGVHVERGHGDGTFDEPIQIASIPDIVSLWTGDLDNDSYVDIALAGFDGSVTIEYGTGTLAGWSAASVAVTGNSKEVQAADVDGDADVDLVVACVAGLSTHFSVLRNLGSRNWAPEIVTGQGGAKEHFALAPFNGDSLPDIVVPSGFGVSTLIGDGLGNFGRDTDFSTGAGPIHVELADMNNDGHLDAVVDNLGCPDGCVFSVLHGDGEGSLLAPRFYESSGRLVGTGDGDADGWPELIFITADGVPGYVIGRHLSPAAPAASFHRINTSLHVDAVRVADVNGDGKDDLLLWAGDRLLDIAVGEGSGYAFNPLRATLNGAAPLFGPWATPDAADMNGDGKADLVFKHSGQAQVWLGDGAGVFTRTNVLDLNENVVATALGDVNGDGKPDAISIFNPDIDAYFARVLLNDGNGALVHDQDIPIGLHANRVAIADVDGDGVQEFVVSSDALSSFTSVHPSGAGAGFIGALRTAPVGFATGDLDEDGADDLVFPNPGLGTVSVVLAIPDRTTPALASLIEAFAEPGLVRVAWYSNIAVAAQVTLERRSAEVWEARAQLTADGANRLRYEDRDVVAGTRYAYRLRIVDGGRTWFSDEVTVQVPDGLAFGRIAIHPNPARSEFEVAFEISDPAPVEFEILDVSGRRVQHQSLAGLGAGSHVIAPNRARLDPGLYWVVVRQAGRSATKRVVVVE